MNSRIKNMVCLKCGASLPVGDYIYGCPNCFEKGENSNIVPVYEEGAKIHLNEKGMKRYQEFLPYTEFPTLGEGCTPVVSLERLAEDLGLRKVYTKNEFQNPSGSHKDRINPLAVAHAKATGKNTICCASTGNEAVSCALYCAAAGMRCVCVVTKEITPIWKKAIEAAGAEMVMVDSPDERMRYIEEKLKTESWYCVTNQPDPPIGSPAVEVQGYKTVSYELYEQFENEIPEYILVPTCRGDLLYGMYCGFNDLLKNHLIEKMPRLVAMEPIPRLECVLQGKNKHTDKFEGATNLMPSIGGGTVTYQAQIALEESGGFAISVPQENAYKYVKGLAQYGLYTETSSAIALECLKKAVKEGGLPHNARVLLVLTSHGFKNDF